MRNGKFSLRGDVDAIKGDIASLQIDVASALKHLVSASKTEAGDIKDKVEAELRDRLSQLSDRADALAKRGRRAVEGLEGVIEEKPLQSVGIALGVGVLAGVLLRGSEPVKNLARFIVRVSDLVEAEGRALRESSVMVGLAVAMSLAAAAIGIGGTFLLVWGLFEALRQTTGSIGAALVCGIVLLASAGGLAWLAMSLGRKN